MSNTYKFRILTTISVLSFLLLFTHDIKAQESSDFINKVDYFLQGDMHLSKFASVMPVPVSNEYQIIENFTCTNGNVLQANGTNKILYTELSSCLGNKITVGQHFKITTIPVHIDFSNKGKKNVCPSSDPPENYLGSDGTYIKLTNKNIKKIGDELWNQAQDTLDYARRCYEYVAANFKYIKKGEFRTLSQIFSDGGGECGDLSTLVVNLLRYKGIPARHNITLQLNGGWHVWLDFYHKDYGWIPIDPTYKNSNPKGDYFGHYQGGAVIVSQDITDLNGLGVRKTSYPLQTYCYSFLYDRGYGEIKAVHTYRKQE